MPITTTRQEDNGWQWLAEAPHSAAPPSQGRSSDAGHALVVGLLGLVCVVALAVVYYKFFYRYCTACDVGITNLQRNSSRMAYLRRTLSASARVRSSNSSDGGLAYNVIKTLPSFVFRQVIEEQAGVGSRGSHHMQGRQLHAANRSMKEWHISSPGTHPSSGASRILKVDWQGWNPAPAASPGWDPACRSLRECPICLGSYHSDDHVRLLPACCHCFHLSCIDTWLLSHASCPLCRSSVFPPPVPDKLKSSSFIQVMAPPLPYTTDFSIGPNIVGNAH